MFKLLSTIAFLVTLCGAANARCVTSSDVDSGITFKQESGAVGIIERSSQEVSINYGRSTTGSIFRLYTGAVEGLFETGRIADNHFDETTTYFRAPTKPEPETDQLLRVKIVFGTQTHGRYDEKYFRQVWQFGALRSAKLSGCEYRVFSANLIFGRGKDRRERRYVYFADLGFGLLTREAIGDYSEENGLIALYPSQ